MKNLILILILLVVSLPQSLSQVYSEYFGTNVITKETYVNKKEYGIKRVFIPFHFNTSKTHLNDTILKLPLSKIRSIEYIKTNHDPKRQTELDNERFNKLLEILPKSFKRYSQGFNFILVNQTNQPSRNLFHGFVISYEINTSKKSVKILDEILSSDSSLTIEETDFYFDTLDEYEYYIPTFIPGMDFSFSLDKDIYGNFDTSSSKNLISVVLKRNPEIIRNSLITIDVTGSMMPYIAQVLIWQKLYYNKNNKQSFVFFNDGNRTPDYKKKTGNVGGIYQIDNSKGIKEVENMAKKAMSNGYGGDCPENNLEAVIKGLKKFPNPKNIIMIADNWATPRDLSLVAEINKPIKIILCGVYGSINPAYLDLARETEGSIHTIEEDLKDLMKLKEGETIEIAGHTYIIKKGKFNLISKI